MTGYHIAEAKRDYDGRGGQGWKARCRLRRYYRGAPLDLTATFEDPAPTKDAS